MSFDKARTRELLIIAIFCVFFFFYGLNAIGLVGADEPRYAQLAREMLARGDWVTPTLYGNPWLEKPVLYYWGAMVSYWLLGVRDWAARVPCAAWAMLMAFAIYFFVRRFRRPAELGSALMFCSTVAIFGFARGASTDMPLAATFTIAMLAWFAWYATARKRWLAVFYFFIAFGALAKGPVAPGLALLLIIPFALLRREAKIIARTLWPPGIALFLAVALPWYVMVQLRNPQFFTEFILRQNFARFSSNLYRHHYPWWYYAPVLLLGLFPWTIFSIRGLVYSIRIASGREQEPDPQEGELKGLHLFLILWTVIPVLFFSISQSKLPGYILPAIPAWILLAALYLVRAAELSKPIPAWLSIVQSLWLAAICAGVMLGPRLMVHPHEAIPPNVLRTAGFVFVGVLLFAYGFMRVGGWEMLRFATLLPTILALGFVLKIAAPVIDGAQSARPVAEQLATINRSNLPVAVNHVHRTMEYGLGFYRNQQTFNYEQGEMPAGRHILIAPLDNPGTPPAGTWKRVWVGEFGPQRLGYWWMVPE
jgi:4-amino-4-deoxy-L-arabinose transferase-like glycosyltransferase